MCNKQCVESNTLKVPLSARLGDKSGCKITFLQRFPQSLLPMHTLGHALLNSNSVCVTCENNFVNNKILNNWQ